MRWISLFFLAIGIATAQQLTISVSNAATFLNRGQVAPGSLIAIQPFAFLPQIDPSTVSVNLQPSGAVSPAPLTVVSVSNGFGSVTAVVPANVPLGPAQVTLSFNGMTSAPAQISIVSTSFGLFTAFRYFGPALAQQIGADRVVSRNQLTHPAKPSDYVILWGTGLGSATQDQVTVILGGKPLSPSYAGPAPGEPGVDQINFKVPEGTSIPDGCYVALSVEAAGTRSNPSSISKTSDGSVCRSSLGLTPADLATLDSGGTVELAQLNLSARVGPYSPQVSGGFSRVESADLMIQDMDARSIALTSGPVFSDDVSLGCSAEGGALAFLEVVSGGQIDIGSEVVLSGPAGSLNLTSSGPGYFSGSQTSAPVRAPNLLPPALFAPGTWTFSGSGGSGGSGMTVALPFSQPLVLPPEILAANFNALQLINRQQDQTIAWNAAGFGENDVVTVRLNIADLGAIICTGRAAAGQLTIPASLIQNAAGTAPALEGTLNLFAAPRENQTFALPLSGGGSLPVVFSFYSSQVWPLAIR